MSLLLNSILHNNELQLCVGHTENSDDTDFELYSKVSDTQPISLFDKHFVVSKNVWATDTALNEYPSNDSHYLVDNKVYLCVQNNNGGVSSVKPTGTSVFNYQTTDGYVWRYLFTVQTDDHINHIRVSTDLDKPSVKNAIARPHEYDLSDIVFDTEPVTSVHSENGSGAVIELDYAETAATNLRVTTGGSNYHPQDYLMVTESATGEGATIDYSIVDGAIVINSFTPGGNYVTPKIHVVGDGTGAIIDVTVSAGSIETVVATDGGTDYTWAKLVIAPSENSFVSAIVLESPNGFGFEPNVDIKNKSLMVAKTFTVESDININFIMLTSTTTSNEYPHIYTVNNINNKILSNNSDNLIQVIIDEAIC